MSYASANPTLVANAQRISRVNHPRLAGIVRLHENKRVLSVKLTLLSNVVNTGSRPVDSDPPSRRFAFRCADKHSCCSGASRTHHRTTPVFELASAESSTPSLPWTLRSREDGHQVLFVAIRRHCSSFSLLMVDRFALAQSPS